MSKKIVKILMFLGFISLLSLAYINESIAENIGDVSASEGIALLRRASESEFKKVTENEILKLADTLQTDSNSKLYLKFSDSSHASLGENSELYIFDFARDKTATFFGADVSSGSTRFIKKLQDTNPGSSYTITTPTAMINVDPSDRLTDFVVIVHSTRKTTITVVRGQVRVKNISENLTLERLVDSCRMINVEEGKDPSRVSTVSTARLKELIDITTIPNTLTEDVPECDKRYVYRSECQRCTIWDGTQCVPCADCGLICLKGRCVNLDCGPCKIQWDGRCVPCRELGLICDRGRCVRKNCPPCRMWDGRRCVLCEDFGRVCIDGRCVRPLDCPQCSFWNGRRCVGCAELGMLCINGRCVFRPCGPCEVRRGNGCATCAELGMRCEGGRCVRVIPVEKHDRQGSPERPIDVKPLPGPGVPPVLPPAQGIVPLPGSPIKQPKPEPPSVTPEDIHKPGRPEKPAEKPDTGKLPIVTPEKPLKPILPPERQTQPQKDDKPSRQDAPPAQSPGTIPQSPKPLETEPGPRPTPMPEAPKLDQKRDHKLERPKPAQQTEQSISDVKPGRKQDRITPETKPSHRPDQNLDRSSQPPVSGRPETKMERQRPEPQPRLKPDRRDDEKKER